MKRDDKLKKELFAQYVTQEEKYKNIHGNICIVYFLGLIICICLVFIILLIKSDYLFEAFPILKYYYVLLLYPFLASPIFKISENYKKKYLDPLQSELFDFSFEKIKKLDLETTCLLNKNIKPIFLNNCVKGKIGDFDFEMGFKVISNKETDDCEKICIARVYLPKRFSTRTVIKFNPSKIISEEILTYDKIEFPQPQLNTFYSIYSLNPEESINTITLGLTSGLLELVKRVSIADVSYAFEKNYVDIQFYTYSCTIDHETVRNLKMYLNTINIESMLEI